MLTTEEKQRYVTARRKIIQKRYEKLNLPQQQAVMTTSGPLLLLAGAGSGKTTVLIERIANLVNFGEGSDSDEVEQSRTGEDLAVLEGYLSGVAYPEGQVLNLCRLNNPAPWNILAITFTKKAAGELKERLEQKLGTTARDVWAFTFHSACVRILRRDLDKLGISTNFTIYDVADCENVVKASLKELDMDTKTFPPRSILGEISRAKDAQLLAKEYASIMEKEGDFIQKAVAKIYLKYEKKLRSAEALDFDDIILNTVRLLEHSTEVREYYQKKFRYVLIDEYQDTNQLQYRLATLLAGGYQNFCVVGDDDQSIYRFRGATIENILNFEHQYTGCRVIRLEENYRSSQNILTASNAVISNNRGRKGKKLWTQAEDGELLSCHMAENEIQEAQYIVESIMANYGTGRPWRDHALLYRVNAQSNQLENACKRAGIPYRIVGGTRFFDRLEVKDMVAYLTVLSNPEDDLRLVRIINRPTRGIGNTTVERAEEIALREGVSLFTVLDNASMYPELQRSAKKLQVFAQLIGEMAVMVRDMPLADFYEVLLEKTGYIKALEEKKLEENQTRIENVRELLTSINGYVQDIPEGQLPTLEGFLDEIALFTNLDNHDEVQDYVTMMTMHSAKGLEFPVVYLPGFEEGIFPGSRAIGEEAEMEEERRLCYVALTRAKEKLHLCRAGSRMLYGNTNYNKSSRFLEEIPQDIMEMTGGIERKAFVSESTGSYHAPDFRQKRNEGTGIGGKTGMFASAMAKQSTVAETLEKYQVGDTVKHTAFGLGTVTKITASGGDNLLQIDFVTKGEKRLLQKSTTKFLKKEG